MVARYSQNVGIPKRIPVNKGLLVPR